MAPPPFQLSNSLFSVILLLIPLVPSIRAAQGIPIILHNAKIYTIDPTNPWAEAIAINDEGVIEMVGTNQQVMRINRLTKDTIMIDLKGRLLLPGFQDVHLHAVEAGINADLCYVDQDAPINDLPFYFDDCPNRGQFGDQGWIVGVGIDIGILLQVLETDFDQEYPITVLDRAYPNTPVLILDNLGHGAVANSKAMQLVAYDDLAGDPPGGVLMRDEQTNFLTGIVLENAQQKLRDAAFPASSQANQERAYESLLQALEVLAQNGITSVSDAGGFWRQAQTESWARAQEQEGVLTVRASNALYIYPDMDMDEQLSELTSRYSNDVTKLVRFNQAKIYVDGILSLATGALYQPYDASLQLPPAQERGYEYFGNAATLNQISQILVDNGFQLHYHVTGDRGAGLALDAIEQLNTSTTTSNGGGPHRLTHCYLVDEQDRARFQQLGIVADFQVAPSSVDPAATAFLESLIGTTRAAQLLPALELYQESALITLSSDWDADELSPLVKIKTVLNRPDGRSFADLETVIPMMTINAAQLLGTNTGSIEVGKLADLVVLDTNIFDVPSNEIDQAQVVMTMFQGEVIFDPTGIAGAAIGVGSRYDQEASGATPLLLSYYSSSVAMGLLFTAILLI